MRVLVLGDFHGLFPKKIPGIVKNKKIDLVISIGDYSPFLMRKLFFKHLYAKNTNKGLWEFIGKNKYRSLKIKDNKMTEKILDKLDKLPVKVYTVIGNVEDTPEGSDTNDYFIDPKYKRDNPWDWAEQDFFISMLNKKKNITRIDYRPIDNNGYIFVGMNGHSNKGNPKSKAFKRSKKKLDKIFKKYKQKNKEGKVIFISHNIIYKTKLDKISMKAPKEVRGKHYGSKLARYIVKKYKPKFHFGGHIHEGRGMQKVGKTVCVNVGSVHDHSAALLDLENNKINLIKV